MKILIVDDSVYARKRLARALTGAGHTVVEADSGPTALRLLAEVDPHAATVDLLMPEMDGLELIRRLRLARPDLRIVAVSADVQRATAEQVSAAGASSLVGKTAPLAEILAALQTLAAEPPPLSLSAEQEDIFAELMNIAMGRAANALAALLERRVAFYIPEVKVMSAATLQAFLDRGAPRVGAVVQQSFRGALTGLAALVLPHDHAVNLVRVLLETIRELDQLSSAEQTVLTEVGNIMLNAAVGWIGDQVGGRILLALPTVTLNQTYQAVVDLLFASVPNTAHAVVFLSRLTIGELDLTAYMVLVLPRSDVVRVLDALAR